MPTSVTVPFVLIGWCLIGCIRGRTMRIWIAMGMLMATTVGAYAGSSNAVPEIDALGGLAAMGVVGSIAALIWERRRKK